MPAGRILRRKRPAKKSSTGFNKKQVKLIKKITNSQAELKFVDSTIGFTSLTAGSVASHTIPTMIVGDTESTRDGDKIRSMKWKIRTTLSIVEAGGDGSLVRVFLLKLPATNVDGATALSRFSSMTVNSFYPRDVPFPYRILYDKTHYVSPDNGHAQKQVNITINPNDQIHFNGTGEDDIIGDIYLLLATSNHATASEVTLVGVTRHQYTDI